MGAAHHRHLGGLGEGELAQLVGAPAAQAFQRLPHLEHVPDCAAERPVHRDQECHRANPAVLAERHHRARKFERALLLGKERSVPDLNIEHEPGDSLRELLAQDVRRDQRERGHRAGRVAQVVEPAVEGRDLRRLPGDHAAHVPQHDDRAVQGEVGPEAEDRFQLVERAPGVPPQAPGPPSWGPRGPARPRAGPGGGRPCRRPRRSSACRPWDQRARKGPGWRRTRS